MDRITSSLMAEFVKEFDINGRDESKSFELFSSYICAKKYISEHFEVEDIVVGQGSDTGLDGIAIIVNGTLVNDVDDFKSIEETNNVLDVAFVFVQSETSSSFDSSKVGTFGFGAVNFFTPNNNLPKTGDIHQRMKVMSAIYEKSSKFKRGNPSCILFYVTTGVFKDDKNLLSRSAKVVKDLQDLQQFGNIEFNFVDSDKIQKKYNETKNAVSKEFVFANKVDLPDISGITEAYLGYLPLSQFKSIVSHSDGSMMSGIFYDNVRDWQQYNPVNSEMRDTLKSDNSSRFVVMNNGVTVIARGLQKTGQKFLIEDYQIVNGCQTSHVIMDQDDIDEKITIPFKLIVTQDEDVIESIIRSTNRQTVLKEEQFIALTDFSKKLEAHFLAFDADKRLYYERRACQHDRSDIEKTRIVVVGNVIRSFAAMYLSEPHRTTRNYKSLMDKVGDQIFNTNHRLDLYYCSSYALYKLEYLFRGGKIPAKYKPARFHILLAARIIHQGEKLSPMNSHAASREANKFMEVLWDSAKSDKLFKKAAEAVEHVALGDFDRDNIRTQPFTESLVKYLKEKYESSAVPVRSVTS